MSKTKEDDANPVVFVPFGSKWFNSAYKPVRGDQPILPKGVPLLWHEPCPSLMLRS